MTTTIDNKNANAGLKNKLGEMRKVLEACLDDDYPGELDRALIEAAYADYVKLMCGDK